jgi:hypothetical protein
MDEPVVHTSPARSYRKPLAPGSGESSFQVVVEESDLWIVADRDLSSEALAIVHELRGVLKAHISMNPEFLKSMLPLDVPSNVHPMLRAMYEASKVTGVGPMAGVAGAVAQGVAEGLSGWSSEVLVENGGDLYLISRKERTVGILSDPAGESGVGVALKKEDFPVSICSSSARIGHSLSLGSGDLAVAAARDAALADCAATALCNMLKGPEDLDKAMQKAESWQGSGLLFAFAQCGGKIAVRGGLELAALE